MLMIRLRRMGGRNRPFYRVVVSDSHRVPGAPALEELGYDVEDIKELEYPAAYVAIANGDGTFMADHWDPLHADFYTAAGGDEKLVCVPDNKTFPYYADISEKDDLPGIVMEQIEHFFTHYKDLEKTKWVRIGTWGGAEDAKQITLEAIARYQAAKKA
mgnify:CR=1 FL=1